MGEIPDGSVDMVLCDLPYGTTLCKWDSVIPWEPLWAHYRRVCTPTAAIVLFGTQPFTSEMIQSNRRDFRYCYVWHKKKAANFLFGNKQPLKVTEDIAVFYRKQPTYVPEKRENPRGPERPGRVGIGNTIHDHLPHAPVQSQAGKSYEADKLLPTNLLTYSKPWRPVHPTQKPVDLLAYLIRTYTLPGATVLDNAMGSGSTGVACIREGRAFLGIEKDITYYLVACDRLKGE